MTDESNKNIEHHIDTERKIIHLMLKSHSAIEDMLEAGFSSDFFDSTHKPLVDAIFQEYLSNNSKRLLTRESYRQVIVELDQKNLMPMITIYDKCSVGVHADTDDLGYLTKRLSEGFMGKEIYQYLEEFRRTSKKKGFVVAGRNLADKIQQAVGLVDTRRSVFASLSETYDEYIKDLKMKAENPETIIRCGISEIDDAINVGFLPMNLTLFIADVGGHKTNAMLNVALNIYEAGHSVLFIPLEMHRFSLANRIMANKANVHYSKLARPEMLTPDEWERIEQHEIWKEQSGKKFCILDADERTSVGSLKREIDKYAFVFKPKVVIIDYIANLQPEVRFAGRNDLEIGEILKSLRFLGKKYGFHTISAAQMSRAAIKLLREGKSDTVDSTSIGGSHQYAADADTIFALTPVSGEDDKIRLIVIKSRYGPKASNLELKVEAPFCRITSTNPMMSMTSDPGALESDLSIPTATIVEAEEQSLPDFEGVNLDDDLLSVGE